MPETTPIIYLNEAASAWPKAPGVIEAVAAEISRPPAVRHASGAPVRDVRAECRERLARLLAVEDASRVVLTAGATHALNLGILGLHFPRGPRVVTSCAEHNSVLRPLCDLRERKRIHLRIVRLDAAGEIDREAFSLSLREGASLVVLLHASNVTGRVFDVAPLFAQAKEAGAITLLDASQSLGHVPVHPEELHADLVAFAGHRGLRGPVGTGGLYIAPHLDLAPRFMGATGQQCDVTLQPREVPLCFEPGTPNLPAFAGLLAALRWWEEEGAACRQEADRLSELLLTGLRRLRSVSLYDVSRRVPRVPILSCRLGGWGVLEAAQALQQEFGIYSRAGLHCAPLIHKALGTRPEGTLRFSLSGLNTEADIATTLAAIRTLAARRRQPHFPAPVRRPPTRPRALARAAR
jgi:cysteine desulfurase / selenocysteine lyase